MSDEIKAIQAMVNAINITLNSNIIIFNLLPHQLIFFVLLIYHEFTF